MFSRPLCGSERATPPGAHGGAGDASSGTPPEVPANASPVPTGGALTCSQSYGGHGERETPGNIPNPEAKPLSADGTALETGWESRTPPDNHYRKGPSHQAGALSSSPHKNL